MIAVALFVSAVDAQQSPIPDFSKPIVTAKMSERKGIVPVVVILWDPKRPDHPAPSKKQIEELMFGNQQSVMGWFKENSQGKFEIESAGTLGWYESKKPAEHYWGPPDEGDKDGDGFIGGHTEKWTEAIRMAEKEFDFAKFDKNKNGILEPDELGIIFVIPQNVPFGTMRTPAGREHPNWEPLIVQGVRIPAITEAYAGSPPNLGLFAHELAHLLLDAPDMYMNSIYRAGVYSLMDASYFPCHLGAFEKLKLGWLKPQVIQKSGVYGLKNIETNGDVLILYDEKRGKEEYFLVENRWRMASYYAGGVFMDGLAIWHIIENPQTFNSLPNLPSNSGDWARNGIRFLRANNGELLDDRLALYTRGQACEPKWADGTPSGFRIEMLGNAGAFVRVKVEKR
jgi:M6 family metalloprotease-like protein